jgi:hypothetical protein
MSPGTGRWQTEGPRIGPSEEYDAILMGQSEKISHLCIDTLTRGLDNARLVLEEGYSSGQRGQTVNLLAMPT